MTVYYNEIDPFCCQVLRKQIGSGNLPQGFVDERDIRDVPTSELAGYHQFHLFAGIGGIPLGLMRAGIPDDFNICTGGFPCQDISFAGRGAGLDGERSGLWFEFARVIRDLRPRYALVENVPGLLIRGLDRVLGSLATLGYDAEWESIPACALGAPHIRERIFILAYPHEINHERSQIYQRAKLKETQTKSEEWISTGGFRGVVDGQGVRRIRLVPDGRIRGMADGIPGGVERIGAIGNAVVPQVAQYIGMRIIEMDEARRFRSA